ncbi:MAG: 50S ribosomal protein L29 [Planctomycetes bacterium]|nr:50S ribosomal protein L29 [Planctomycetota bacterium]
MKIDEIRGKTGDELEYELKNLRKELFDLRFKSATQSLQSPAKIRQLKRTIARLLTIQNERTAGIRGQEPR